MVDWKSTLVLTDRWKADRLEEAHYSWQLYDYLWRASEYLKTPVRWALHQIIVCDPFEVLEASVRVTDAQLDHWQAQARHVWRAMDGFTWPNWTRCRNFGFGSPCDFEMACWQDGGTPNPLEYVKER